MLGQIVEVNGRGTAWLGTRAISADAVVTERC